MDTTPPVSRRRLLALSGAAVATMVAGCTDRSDDDDTNESARPGQPNDGRTYVEEEPEYGDWFDNVANYQGTVDETGRKNVLVANGTGRSGMFFDPPAIRITTETTVVWEWTGRGGYHTVTHEDREFRSRQTDAAGATFSYMFDEPGTYRYVCEPHQNSGQKGAIDVVE